MVLASPTPISEKIELTELPIIDLSTERSEVAKLIVEACEKYGFFKVINHGVDENIIAKMEEESFHFFAKPITEKQQAGPPTPFGYGLKNIGFKGDNGEVEYLLLHTNPRLIDQTCKSISSDPTKFRSAVSCYIEAVRDLACEILDLMAEGLWVHDKSVFSSLIRDVENDSFFRLNHYPALVSCKDNNRDPKVGFGEHSDPQILTILRSNAVCGLQISIEDGVWIPVSPDPTAFCVNVGDVLQAMTNGRFMSVRHRAMSNSCESRMSMAFFGGPPLDAKIAAPPEIITANKPSLYIPFTWAEYKQTAYALRLGDSRLDLFRKSRGEKGA